MMETLSSGYHLDTAQPDQRRSRRRHSPSSNRMPSRQRSRSRDRSPRRPSMVLERRASNAPVLPEVTKARLCIEGFFYANQYEGPYGKHIAIIIHVGNGMLVVGLFTAILTFVVFKDNSGVDMDVLKVAAMVLLTIGFATSVSTATVYSRAYKSRGNANSGRLNLHSRDILFQTTSAVSLFVVLIGLVVTPLSYALEGSYSIFYIFKVVGLCYIIFGLIIFCGITAYSRIVSSPDRSRNRFRPTRSRTNSHVPQIRIGHDAGSEITGSDIAVSEISDAVNPSPVPFGIIPEPPPYTVIDPNPNYSDTGSTVNTVSAAHSLVTLLQFAYADELQTPPPPYEEQDGGSQTRVISPSGESLALEEQQQEERPEGTSVSPVSLISHSHLHNESTREITRTESGLTVPDL